MSNQALKPVANINTLKKQDKEVIVSSESEGDDGVIHTLAEVPTQIELDFTVDPSREAAMEQARQTMLS